MSPLVAPAPAWATSTGLLLVRLVVGADVLPQTPQWKAWDDIVREFPPIVVGRANHPPVADSLQFPDVSSTEIRRRLQAREPIAHLVTARVHALLAER